ncbi:MAG: PEP-CTERM sorting domain-containing protein [Chroococcus sp. CMT-3BRIN-NPC107]|nr:PEP-CTERM sorting domain-containing protein [Chroococcus sp. CMT-3BRIN-NPC107]
MADNTTQDLNELLRQSPFGPLLDIQGADGNNLTVEDIFGNVGGFGGSNPFASGGSPLNENSPYGGNPFAGDNFWNLFAGGMNPSNPIGSNSGTGGSLPIGTNNPFPVELPTGANNPFPVELPGGGSIPPFLGDRDFPGLPGHGGSTPVPEPSSILGLVVIGMGIAATKFRQQRKAAKVFNK